MTACPKPRPKALEKRDRLAARDKIDRAERAKVRARSGGRCEVIESVLAVGGAVGHSRWIKHRCLRAAHQNHHLKGGIGRRNRGVSILAAHRLDVCDRCHADITDKILKAVGPGREDAATVYFERAK